MKQILRILMASILITAIACQRRDEAKMNVSWSQEAAQMLNSGIKVGCRSAYIALDFLTEEYESQTEFSVTTNETWIEPTITLTDAHKGELHIKVLENDDIFPRHGEVRFALREKSITIKISQEGNPKVLADKNSYTAKSDGGNVEVRVKANGNISARIYPYDCEWARIVKTTPRGNNEYTIAIDVDKNNGLGRITSLQIKLTGEEEPATYGPCLIQEPAPFPEDLTVTTEKAGCLQILMGNDPDNLRRIRKLKLIGAINRIDLPLLQQLFANGRHSVEKYQIDSIDLSECVTESGNLSPFQKLGWTPTKVYEDILWSREIPSGIFSNAVNLKSIILPNELSIIGRSAFSGCKSLKRITIPNSVGEICSRAFYLCTGLEEINISPHSKLHSIEDQAFATGSVLKELTIPMGAERIATGAFLGCATSALHLKWTEPIEVRIVPKREGCTLFVPKGTKALYQNSPNWSKFKNIIEE